MNREQRQPAERWQIQQQQWAHKVQLFLSDTHVRTAMNLDLKSCTITQTISIAYSSLQYLVLLTSI